MTRLIFSRARSGGGEGKKCIETTGNFERTLSEPELMYFLDNNFVRSFSPSSITDHKLPRRGGSSFDIRPVLLRDQARFIRCNNNVYPRYRSPVYFTRGQFYRRQAQPVRIHNRVLYTLSALAVAPLFSHYIYYARYNFSFYFVCVTRALRLRFGERRASRS